MFSKQVSIPPGQNLNSGSMILDYFCIFTQIGKHGKSFVTRKKEKYILLWPKHSCMPLSKGL